jgi:hypothetical protein
MLTLSIDAPIIMPDKCDVDEESTKITLNFAIVLFITFVNLDGHLTVVPANFSNHKLRFGNFNGAIDTENFITVIRFFERFLRDN